MAKKKSTVRTGVRAYNTKNNRKIKPPTKRGGFAFFFGVNDTSLASLDQDERRAFAGVVYYACPPGPLQFWGVPKIPEGLTVQTIE